MEVVGNSESEELGMDPGYKVKTDVSTANAVKFDEERKGKAAFVGWEDEQEGGKGQGWGR